MKYNESPANAHWQTLKLRELGDFSRGLSKHRPRNDVALFSGGGYPLIQTGEIREANLYVTSHHVEYGEFGLRQSKLWDADTLCITIAANIAETAILSYPMCFPDSVVGFTANKKLTSELFVYYVFEYIRMAIKNAASGSAQDNINIEYLTSLEFKVPNKAVQDSIVGVLASLDRMILLNNQVNDILQAMLQTLYGYWFLQFDFPDENGRPYRSSGGRMVWNDQLKREIPAGWRAVTLRELLKKNRKAFDYGTVEPTIDLSVMPTGSIALNNLSRSDAFSSNLYQMSEGDILFGAIRPYLKKAGIAPCNGVVAGTVHSFSPVRVDDYNFALATITSEQMFSHAVRSSTGTRMPTVKADDLLDVVVAYSESVATAFNQIPVARSIIERVQESSRLGELRNWLLPMLMNGQATVANSDELSFT